MSDERVYRKSQFFKKRSFCWIKNRKLISITESFYDPQRDTEAIDKNGDDINPLLRLPGPFDDFLFVRRVTFSDFQSIFKPMSYQE
jgi:hypothetical protein